MYVQNLVKMLLSYRGTFEIKGKFKDLPSVLRHEIMSHYRTKFTNLLERPGYHSMQKTVMETKSDNNTCIYNRIIFENFFLC